MAVDPWVDMCDLLAASVVRMSRCHRLIIVRITDALETIRGRQYISRSTLIESNWIARFAHCKKSLLLSQGLMFSTKQKVELEDIHANIICCIFRFWMALLIHRTEIMLYNCWVSRDKIVCILLRFRCKRLIAR